MTKSTRSFIIRFYNDEHGMRGIFASIQEAVDHINEYYKDIMNICDHKGRCRWIVVCEDRTKITNRGEFLSEKIHRYIAAKAIYSEQAGKYIYEEVPLQRED